jgi:hypothetical protein
MEVTQGGFAKRRNGLAFESSHRAPIALAKHLRERLIGLIRRKCLDHVMDLYETGLRRIEILFGIL